MLKASILNWLELKSNETSMNIPQYLTRFSGMLFLKKMSTFYWGDNSPISKGFSMLGRSKRCQALMMNHSQSTPLSYSSSNTFLVWVKLFKIGLEVVKHSSNPKGFFKIASRLGSYVLFSSQAVRLPRTFPTTSPDFWGVVSEESVYLVPKNASGTISLSRWPKSCQELMKNYS